MPINEDSVTRIMAISKAGVEAMHNTAEEVCPDDNIGKADLLTGALRAASSTASSAGAHVSTPMGWAAATLEMFGIQLVGDMGGDTEKIDWAAIAQEIAKGFNA